MLDLKPIQDRLSAVTPGIWQPVELPQLKYVGVTAEQPDGDSYHVCATEDCDPEDALPNAVFIAHAKADVAALVAEVERLRAQVDALEQANDQRDAFEEAVWHEVCKTLATDKLSNSASGLAAAIQQACQTFLKKGPHAQDP